MAAEKTPDKIYSVSELNSLSQGVLERGVGEVWVRGEISGLKTQPSGHIYFSLKDEKSVLSVALFKGSAMKNGVKLVEGKQILVFGEVGIYLPRGSYQMVAKFILDEGAGRLREEFERLKKQLEAEGLFSKERKIEIPKLPRVVAFITSPTGAVWQDFTGILARRDWCGRAILFPCRVQGAEAPMEIVEQLKRADAWGEGAHPTSAQGFGGLPAPQSKPLPKGGVGVGGEKPQDSLFSWANEKKQGSSLVGNGEENLSGGVSEKENYKIDLIVVGRGGGSLEDLWAFNDERVVRQVAAMQRPIISAVGHETDFTLCDFAADFRAETPSAAAELIAGHFNDARGTAEDLAHRLSHAARRAVMALVQRFGDLMARLMGHSPRIVLDRALQRLDEIEDRMQRGLQHRLLQNRERLSTLAAQLNGLNPEVTLKRGYAMVRDAEGQLITRAAMAREGQEVEIKWADGEKKARTQN